MVYVVFHFLAHHEVYRTAWWMGLYDAPTPKRHYAWGNSRRLAMLDRGKLIVSAFRARQPSKVVTATRKRKPDGTIGYQGTKALRATECPGCKLGETNLVQFGDLEA